jgi:ribosomal protein L7Ae-like RNA K-turn-binding protein
MRKGADDKYLKHIKRLCEEKNVPIEYYNLKKYNVCGIIKEVADL